MCLFEFISSSILQIWYVDVRIFRSISESPLEFEITRVDCTLFSFLQYAMILYAVSEGPDQTASMRSLI